MSEANDSLSAVHIHLYFVYVRVFGGTLLPVVYLRQKRHHVRNIPDGIQLIRSNLLRRNGAVQRSPIYNSAYHANAIG